MKKLLILASLGVIGTAQAATWEYATFDVWLSGSDRNYFWNSPDVSGKAASTQGKTLTEINSGSNCNVAPRGQKVLQEMDVFNCFGQRGWELLTVSTEMKSAMTVKTYWFKRAK